MAIHEQGSAAMHFQPPPTDMKAAIDIAFIDEDGELIPLTADDTDDDFREQYGADLQLDSACTKKFSMYRVATTDITDSSVRIPTLIVDVFNVKSNTQMEGITNEVETEE